MRADSNDDRITMDQYLEKFKSRGLSGNNQGNKDLFTNIFDVANEILYDQPKNVSGVQLQQRIKKISQAFGDFNLLNECLYENYNWCTHYFDDSLEKTAFFLDQLSRADVQDRFIFKT